MFHQEEGIFFSAEPQYCLFLQFVDQELHLSLLVCLLLKSQAIFRACWLTARVMFSFRQQMAVCSCEILSGHSIQHLIVSWIRKPLKMILYCQISALPKLIKSYFTSYSVISGYFKRRLFCLFLGFSSFSLFCSFDSSRHILVFLISCTAMLFHRCMKQIHAFVCAPKEAGTL